MVMTKQDIEQVTSIVRDEVARAFNDRRRRNRKSTYVKRKGPRATNWENRLRQQATEAHTRDATALILTELARVGSLTALSARALVGARNTTVRALTSLLESGAVRRVAGVYSLAPEGAPSGPTAAQHPE